MKTGTRGGCHELTGLGGVVARLEYGDELGLVVSERLRRVIDRRLVRPDRQVKKERTLAHKVIVVGDLRQPGRRLQPVAIRGRPIVSVVPVYTRRDGPSAPQKKNQPSGFRRSAITLHGRATWE